MHQKEGDGTHLRIASRSEYLYSHFDHQEHQKQQVGVRDEDGGECSVQLCDHIHQSLRSGCGLELVTEICNLTLIVCK